MQVYNKDNTNYSYNGDTTLFPTKCTLETEINGVWVLNFETPLDSKGNWKSLSEEVVVKVDTWQESQLFRVDKCTKTDTIVSCVAYPIFFDSADDCFIVDKRPTLSTGQQALNSLVAGSKYTATSDIITKGTAYFIRRNLMDCINGNSAPTFTQIWGGEILYDNFNIVINNQIGENNGVEIRYGKNMNGYSYTVDMAEVVTRIYPVAYNGYTLTINEGYVDSPNISKYAKKYIKEVKFENIKMAKDAGENPESDIIVCENEQELNTALINACNNMFNAGADLPTVSISTNMVLLAQTEQYKDFENLEQVALGDTVKCINTRLGITTEARVIKLVWDCLRNKPEGVELGQFQYNYFDELTSTLEAVQQVVRADNTVVAEKISGILNAINTQLIYQKNIANKQDVRAILFEDIDQDSPTFGAMALGTQGFQIADKWKAGSTPTDYEWDWTTAFTAKGGYANAIITGILTDEKGLSYWDLTTGQLQLSGEFRQFGESGSLSVAISENNICVYDYKKQGALVGGISALLGGDSANAIGFWGNKGAISLMGYLNKPPVYGEDLQVVGTVVSDSRFPERPPYIANTATGVLIIPHTFEVTNGNFTGVSKSVKVTFQNGLITKTEVINGW